MRMSPYLALTCLGATFLAVESLALPAVWATGLQIIAGAYLLVTLLAATSVEADFLRR